MHGPGQPYWEHQRDFMDWTARSPWIAQSGVPKIDLAFWLKKSEFFDITSAHEANDLQDAGYSYEYLSPDNFDIPAAEVVDGVFAPNRQAFKALIVRANDSLTVSGVQYLLGYAEAGLPIVFSGGIPENLTGHNDTGLEYVRSVLPSILNLSNVHSVPYDNLASSLRELDILSRTRATADRTWYTYWREDASSNVTYVYVYNDAWDSELGEGISTGAITFETTGVPYEYDAWTGDIKPLLAYQQTATTTTVELRLAGNQSTVIGFHHNEIAQTGIRFLSFPQKARGQLLIGTEASSALLSNGSSISLPVPATPHQLSSWKLTIESWSPPPDLESSQTQASLSNSTYTLTKLQPWNALSDSLRNVSGLGIYSTTFPWPPTNGGNADGAILSLGATINTARASINGHQLPALDPTDARADIGAFLIEGMNVVEVVVASTLGNALRPVYKDVRSSGTLWLGPVPEEQEYGLVGNVSVVPYLNVVI